MYEENSQDASFISESSTKKKKRGFKKIGSSIRFALGGSGKKRGKKKNKDGRDNTSEDGSYSATSGSRGERDNTSGFVRSDGSPNTAAQQEWIASSGGNGLADMAAIGDGRMNSAGGRGKSLTKIAEEDLEDSAGDYNGDAAAFRRGSNEKRRGTRPRKSPSNASVGGSVSSKGSRFGFKKTAPVATADPLSLVVLLVDPESLRFELLSLDFDLTSYTGGNSSKKKKKKRQHPEDGHDLMVQDVLDQIAPSALTDEKLRQRVQTPGACKGLIDRKGQIHFGTASLERACACRPLRAVDKALQSSSSSGNGSIKRGTGLLSVPTYGGEPHRDVLLGFFGDDADGSSISQETMASVAKSLELARPIFSDPNVIELMEKGGYVLSGWKPSKGEKGGATVESTKLGKPLESSNKTKKKRGGMSLLARTILGLLVVLLATVLARSVVSGGLDLLPGDGSSFTGGDGDGPVTLEGYLAHGFQLARAWYYGGETIPTSTN